MLVKSKAMLDLIQYFPFPQDYPHEQGRGIGSRLLKAEAKIKGIIHQSFYPFLFFVILFDDIIDAGILIK
jgi:hypothetical protein